MAIAAKTARYITLETKSEEIRTLDRGDIWLGAEAVTDELAREGDVEKIKQYLLQQGYSPQAAAAGAQEAIDFYNLGADCLWITFARDHLWWTFADPEVIWLMNDFNLTDKRVRNAIRGWRNADIYGAPLGIDQLSNRIVQLASIGHTDPDVETLQELLQIINGGEGRIGDKTCQPVAASATVENSARDLGERTAKVPSALFTVGEIIKKPSVAPNAAGIYAWWFDELPNVPLVGAWEQRGFRLAYVGIASYRPENRRTIRQRLRNHCNGPIATSTLRRSLAAVLIDELDLHPFKQVGKIKLSHAEETKLSDWLTAHGRVAWIADATPWAYETELLRSGPPLALNIRGNNHEFVAKLLALRQQLSRGSRRTSPDVDEVNDRSSPED